MKQVTKADVRQKKTEDSEHEIQTECGFGSCRPRWLQKLNSPPVLCFFLSVFAFFQGFAVNGINNVNTTSYERRFNLPSSRVGWISSSYDISAALLGILVGFYGANRNKPRTVCVAFLISACGSACMFLPHFITGLYQWGQNSNKLCVDVNMPEQCDKGDESLGNYMGLLVLGQLLHGVGGSTLITVGFSLIDDSVPAHISPVYIGILNMCNLLGPMAGYAFGGQMLNIYTDFDQVSKDSIDLTASDPRWVGAWWLGFVFSSSVMFLSAIPLCLFGSELPTARAVRESRVSETHSTVTAPRHHGEPISIRQLPSAAGSLARNPVFICVCVSLGFKGMVATGVGTFLPKIIQTLFGTTPSLSATVSGLFIVSALGIGQLLGGLVIRIRKMNVRSILRYILITFLLGMTPKASFLLHCDSDSLVGWDIPYSNQSTTSLISLCNSDCHCKPGRYEPICDRAGTRYVTPCLAGCTNYTVETKTYTDCLCVPATDEGPAELSFDNCSTRVCNSLYIFIALLFLSTLTLATGNVPAITAVLRSTHESERTFALAGLNLLARVIGTIPGPIIYGATIDTTCTMWGQTCGERTSCWLYDTGRVGVYMTVLGYSISAVALIFDFLAFKLYKPPKDGKYQVTQDQGISREKNYGTVDTGTGVKHDTHL